MTMKIRTALAAAALLVAALLAAAPVLRAQESGIAVGTKAPAAVVETLDGRSVDLAQYIGKTPVLIEFWAVWCPSCKELEPALLAAQRKYGAQVKFVGVAVSANESPEGVRRYVASHKIQHDILYDRHGNAVGAYDVPATSYVVVIDRSGKIVYTGQGGDQNLEAAVKKGM